MKMALIGRNKFGLVDGFIPAVGDEDILYTLMSIDCSVKDL
jgi:hypothetical protein